MISVPVWGDRYLRIFEEATWPALKIALEELNKPHTVFVHTDPDNNTRLQNLMAGHHTVFHQVVGPDRAFQSLTDAHSQVINGTPLGHKICLLTADLVLSKNTLASADARLSNGYTQAFAMMGMRACEEELPVAGLSGRELLSWAWDHRHPMTADSTWPDGKSYDVWRMYFQNGDEVACRLCLPHPTAFNKTGRSHYFFPTCDVNLLSNFVFNEIHLVTDPDEGAMIELSPKEKEYLLTESMQWRYDTGGPSLPPFWKATNERHIWLFNQKIIIKGNGGDCGDTLVVRRILSGQ
jgi:hypothetical protein